MSRSAFVACAVGLGLCTASWAVAEPTKAEAAERQQIQRERADIEARFRKGQADCAKRFFVTSCVDALQVQRREALAGLREREIVLDEAQRRRDAEESARRIADKRAEAEARPKPEPRAPPAPRASAPAPTQSERAKWRSKTAHACPRPAAATRGRGGSRSC